MSFIVVGQSLSPASAPCTLLVTPEILDSPSAEWLRCHPAWPRPYLVEQRLTLWTGGGWGLLGDLMDVEQKGECRALKQAQTVGGNG